jgi:uncharacterized protein (TIGR02594 family)
MDTDDTDLNHYDIAQRFIGTGEVSGSTANPMILAMLKLDSDWPEDDSVPWCSAFMNYIAWLCRLPRSKSLRARSWLMVGRPVLGPAMVPEIGDVVILKRGHGKQPGPEIVDAPGHVGFFAGMDGDNVLILGGNQSDTVKVSTYPVARILGIRRLV